MKWRSEHNFPPGGWVYEADGGFLIRRSNRADLVRAVAEHHAGLGAQGFDAEQAVLAQMCAKHPGLCSGDREKPPAPLKGAPKGNPLFRAVGDHLDRVFRRLDVPPQLTVTHDAEVTRRLGICRTCPAAREVASFGCSTCGTAIAGARTTIGGKKDPTWLAAPVCSAMGVDCFAAARVGTLQPSVPETRLPARCWAASRSGDPVHDDNTETVDR